MDWDAEQQCTLNGLREAYRAKQRRYLRLDGDEGLFLYCREDRSGGGVQVPLGSFADYRNFIASKFLLENKSGGQGSIAHKVLSWDATPSPAVPIVSISGSGNSVAIQAGDGNIFAGHVRADANSATLHDAQLAAIEAIRSDLPESDRAAALELLEGAIAEGRHLPPRSTCVTALLAAASSRCMGSFNAQTAISAVAAELGISVRSKLNADPMT